MEEGLEAPREVEVEVGEKDKGREGAVDILLCASSCVWHTSRELTPLSVTRRCFFFVADDPADPPDPLIPERSSCVSMSRGNVSN